jgi:energy-coupling factor transporter ATP-binding protein EcfA2
MQITSFWAKGYRSLADVRVDNLGRFNVFYGKNGSGKSNILAAMRTLFELTWLIASHSNDLFKPGANLASMAVQRGIIARRDLSSHDPTRKIILGATLTGDGLEDSGLSIQTMTIEVTLQWAIENQPTLAFSALRMDEDVFAPSGTIRKTPNDSQRAFLINLFPRRIFALVGADRAPRPELKKQAESIDVVGEHLRAGRLKNALLAAQNDPNHRVRRQLTALRQILSGPPLHRPPFDPVLHPVSGEVDLRELISSITLAVI